MTRANGSLDFLSNEDVVGIAFSVERMYFGGALACGDGVTEDWFDQHFNRRDMIELTFGGRMIAGGG